MTFLLLWIAVIMGGLTLFIVLIALCMWIRDEQHEQKLKETYHIDSIYHLQEPTQPQPHQSHQPEPLTTPFTQLSPRNTILCL
ncbi:hypothetical protein AC1031_020559 [Aphanomyces cochlioides]|nr:hypothetical protein AC1031_020559 [Aphanomyces cochlioides]